MRNGAALACVLGDADGVNEPGGLLAQGAIHLLHVCWSMAKVMMHARRAALRALTSVSGIARMQISI